MKALLLPLLMSILWASNELDNDSYTDPETGKIYYPAPSLDFNQLALPYYGFTPKNLHWIKAALELRQEAEQKQVWPKYRFGSSSLDKGGYDCSGAIYAALKTLNTAPPRTSSQQYEWLLNHGQVHKVAPEAQDLNHDSLDQLQPGDLVFWSGTYTPTDARKHNISHVGMFLGYQNDYERPIMICSSKGRYYKGKPRDGYGIYDFKLPSKTSKSKIVAYGRMN